MAKERSFSIFLVDDDSKHLLLLKEHLIKHLPYPLDIATFTEGEECLRNLNGNPDMIFLDYFFDGVSENAANGLEILKRIRKKQPDIPVVMMSHQDNLEVAVTCYEYGVQDYIIKNETAFARAQLVVRNFIHDIIKEAKTSEYRSGVKTATVIISIFVMLLIGIIIFLIFESSLFG